MRNQESTAQYQGGDHPPQPQTLTVAEAAQLCGLSASTSCCQPGCERVAGRPWRWSSSYTVGDLRSSGDVLAGLLLRCRLDTAD
jgi:hypothetical protein